MQTISQPGEVLRDRDIQLRRLGLLLSHPRDQPRHLLLEGLGVDLTVLSSNVTRGREDVAVLADLLDRRTLTEVRRSWSAWG